MEISEELKLKFKESSVHKDLIVRVPQLNLTIENDRIDHESLNLKEYILEKNNMEFVGCISSMLSVTVNEIAENLKGQRLEVFIKIMDTEIPLFHGYVDSCMRQENKNFKKITAYDDLYTKGNIDVSSWYSNLLFPITQRDFRNSLFQYLEVVHEDISLPNDNMFIEKKYDPKQLKGLNVIKALCQINGVFGIINRAGKFEYRILKKIGQTSTYPSMTLYPAGNIFPVNPNVTKSDIDKGEIVGYYTKVDYEDYQVKPVDKLTIRQSADDLGISVGAGNNNYIIQGNMFTYGKTNDELSSIASSIYKNVSGIFYYPFKGENNGLPYVECGDIVSYYSIDGGIKNFYVFGRELKGIQSIKDSYSAKGEEYQREIVTDLNVNIDLIKQDIKETVDNSINNYDFSGKFGDYTYDKSEIDGMFDGFQGGIKIESVEELPPAPSSDTIYLIRGKVVMI